MLVETMTYDEIVHELKKDREFLEFKSNQLAKKDVKALKARDVKEFPYCYTREVVSNRKNRYIISFEVLTHTALKTLNEVSSLSFALLERPGKGLYVYALAGKKYAGHVVEYTPHFFHRYAERTGFEGSPMQVIRHYFNHNPKELTTTALANETTYMACATEEGVAFGVIENGHHLTRTFVTYDLLFPGQKHFQEALMEPTRLMNRYNTNKYDKENIQKMMAKALTMSKDSDNACLGLWKSYAKIHLKMNASVRMIERGRFELIDKGNSEDSPVSSLASKLRQLLKSGKLSG